MEKNILDMINALLAGESAREKFEQAYSKAEEEESDRGGR